MTPFIDAARAQMLDSAEAVFSGLAACIALRLTTLRGDGCDAGGGDLAKLRRIPAQFGGGSGGGAPGETV